LTDVMSFVPSSLKMTWLAAPAVPVAGVVWFRPKERSVLGFEIRPSFESGV